MKMRLAYETTAAYSAPRSTAAAGNPLNLAGRLSAVLDMAARWQRRRIERRAMRQLDDHMLRDIGLGRLQMEEMAARPFWRA